MPLDAHRPDLVVGVIGTGAMGRGIVQVAAAGGVNVLMTDARPGAAEEARGFVGKMLARAAEKGGISQEEAERAVGRIRIAEDLSAFKQCHVVIEAIVENLDAKRELFGELEDIVAPDCILATNTSSLSVTTIAAQLRAPERFAGLSFFQSGAAHAARGSDRGPADAELGQRCADGHRQAHDARARAAHGRPRLSREPGRARLHAGGLTSRLRGCRDIRRCRSRDARCRRLSHGSVRADGAHRSRRDAARIRAHLQPVLPGAALPAESDHAFPLRSRRAGS